MGRHHSPCWVLVVTVPHPFLWDLGGLSYRLGSGCPLYPTSLLYPLPPRLPGLCCGGFTPWRSRFVSTCAFLKCRASAGSWPTGPATR